MLSSGLSRVASALKTRAAPALRRAGSRPKAPLFTRRAISLRAYGPKCREHLTRTAIFGLRPFATFTANEEAPPALVDHFPEVPTNQLLLQAQGRIFKSQPSADDNKAILRYYETISYRAERGDEAAKLTVLIAEAQESDDKEAEAEALAWLEAVSAKGKNADAMYYYALHLATGRFDEIADYPGGAIPEPTYHIDVDNLDEFLGTTHGVTPEGGPLSEQLNFKEWLKSERKKRLAQRKAQATSSSSPATTNAASETTSTESNASCADKKKERGKQSLDLLSACMELKHPKALATMFLFYYLQDAESESVKSLVEMIKRSSDGLALLRAAEVTEDLRLYEKAAETGFAPAIYQLAVIHHDSDASEVAYLKFLELLQKSSALGLPESQYMSGKIDQSAGHEASAFKWYMKAASASKPDPHACFELGVAYFEGSLGQSQNMPLAAKYFKRGGKLGHADCLTNLAGLYYNGWGVEQSFEKAFYTNQNAAVLGSTHAMHNLADMYKRGIGVPQSNEQADYYIALAEGNPGTSEAVLSMFQESVARQNAKPQ